MVRSIVEYLVAPDDPETVVVGMAAGTTRTVSLTVTEGGHETDPVTGECDAQPGATVAALVAEEPSIPSEATGR